MAGDLGIGDPGGGNGERAFNRGVRLLLDCREVCRGDGRRVHFDGCVFRAQVDAHRVVPTNAEEGSGYDVLSGVLLHVIPTVGAIHRTADRIARRQFDLVWRRIGKDVHDFIMILAHMDDSMPVQRATIGRLSAAFRIECRLVQRDDGPPVLPNNAIDTRREFEDGGVSVVELLSHAAIMHIWRHTGKQRFGIFTE